MADKNFIQAAIKKPGALRKSLGIKKGATIPAKELATKTAVLRKKAEGGKKLTGSQSTMLKRLVLARTLKRLSKRKKKRTLMSATAT